tara:strand:- start:414 stop:833 length:420 start_codon:yes stop_codon:yes gene_type:complete
MDEFYYSDEYASEDTDSDDEVEPCEIYCPRQLDYWAIESLLIRRPPPPVLIYLEEIGAFFIREAAISTTRQFMEDVVDPLSAGNWLRFRENREENPRANITFDEWNQILQYCSLICETVNVPDNVYRCMVQILSHGPYR